jgi:membrane protein required for colicin V production
MNFIDLIVIIITSFFLLRGLFRGFVLELTIVIGLIVGYLIAISYYDYLSLFVFKAYFPQIPDSVSSIISFAIIFIAINIGLRLAASAISKTLKFIMLGWLNRLLGAIFGTIKAVLIMGIAVFLINLIPFSGTFMEKAGKNESVFYPVLELIGPELYNYIQESRDIKF